MDLGVHEIRLLVTAGDADVVRTSLAGYADWLLAPPVAYAHLPLGSMTPLPQEASAGQGSNGRVSLLSLSPSNVRMIACKRSADGRALVIRLQESAGVGVTGTVVLWKPDVSATVSFRPFEIKTVRFEKDGRWREVRAVEED